MKKKNESNAIEFKKVEVNHIEQIIEIKTEHTSIKDLQEKIDLLKQE